MVPHSRLFRLAVLLSCVFISWNQVRNSNARAVSVFFKSDKETNELVSSVTVPIKETPIHWEHDQAWFDQQASRGCCPYAKVLYESRYARKENRCCTSRLEELRPLRAVGGVEFEHVLLQTQRIRKKTGYATTVLIQGDSLGEQHFLAVICNAWSLGISVTLMLEDRPRDDPLLSAEGVTWLADIGHDSSLKVRHYRGNRPNVTAHVDYTTPDVIFLGGWHHSAVNHYILTDLLKRVRQVRSSSKATYIVEALPSHFPGGAYRPGGDYPAYNKSVSQEPGCVETSRMGHPNINGFLDDVVNGTQGSHTENVHILHVQELYTHRGFAHIDSGMIPKGAGWRDCMHWCVAPGVLDGIAKETLLAILKSLKQ